MAVSIMTTFIAPDLLGRTLRGAVVLCKHGLELVFEVSESHGYPKVTLTDAHILNEEGHRAARVENPELCEQMFSGSVWFDLKDSAVKAWERFQGGVSK